MISNLRVLLVGALVSVATLASAQTPLEDLARQKAKQMPYLIATSRQCAAFERPPTGIMPPQYTRDSFGRINNFRNRHGLDFAVEYIGDSKVPVAFTAFGKRVAFDQSAPVDKSVLDMLRGRAILYAQVQRACGIAPDSEEPECPIVQRGGTVMSGGCPGGGEIPPMWFEEAFWEDEWEPPYYQVVTVQAPPVPPNSTCVQQCHNGCNDFKGSADIACGGIAGGIGLFMGQPVLGFWVGLACLTGSHYTNIWCRDSNCWGRC